LAIAINQDFSDDAHVEVISDALRDWMDDVGEEILKIVGFTEVHEISIIPSLHPQSNPSDPYSQRIDVTVYLEEDVEGTTEDFRHQQFDGV
jgi:hypothetical protein